MNPKVAIAINVTILGASLILSLPVTAGISGLALGMSIGELVYGSNA